MTKDEALKLALEAFGEIEWSNNSQWQSDRAKVAITAVKEALAQPEQEPVAWEQFYPDFGKPQIAINPETVGYVAPQRTWVGLTDEERKDTLQSVNTGFVVDASVVAIAIEAKLKEKNTRGKND